MAQKIDISTSTIVRFFLVALGLWLLFLLRDVLVLMFLVVIIVAALSPTVDRWAKSITRPGAVVSVFLLILLALAAISLMIVPPLVNQIQDFSQNLPRIAETFSRAGTPGFIQSAANVIRDNLNSLSSHLSDFGSFLLDKTFGIISGIVAVITVLVLSFYLLLEEEGLKKIYRGILPPDLYDELSETTKKVAGKLGAWLRGQLTLMLIIAILDTIGLLIIGSPYALTLGIWAGLTESIPFVGPFLGAVPGIAVNLAHSPLHGILALIIYLVVQQLESNFLAPKIMGKAVGLNPVVVILAILIGDKLYGILGIVLAVPLAAVIGVAVQDWQVIKQTFTNTSKKLT
ncbi:MAG TPA: AI-2E family transporter [Candidatus Saccharimonadales bacterium]|nr:AI-2E family transporter [Candidatus Saccharimonadales bacterium]